MALSIELLRLGPPKAYRVTLLQNADFCLGCSMKNGVGDPIDIGPDEVVLSVSTYPGAVLLFTKTSSPYAHYDGTNGRVMFEIEKTDFGNTARPIQASFEIRRTFPSGLEYVHVVGEIIAEPVVGA
jgi:hypothetical protein